MPPDRGAFETALKHLLDRARESGATSVDVSAGELHRLVGDYPSNSGRARMPVCCSVMKSMMGPADVVLASPPSGQGASLTVRFYLQRSKGKENPLRALRSDTANLVASAIRGSANEPHRDGATRTTVALVSCTKKKRSEACPAAELYISPLFKAMRRYAEQHADAWFILSAQHGLLDPGQEVEPYERTLSRMNAAERTEWERAVCQVLQERLPKGAHVLMLAGAGYRDAIVPLLKERGHTVDVPLADLGIGRQLAWLKERSRP